MIYSSRQASTLAEKARNSGALLVCMGIASIELSEVTEGASASLDRTVTSADIDAFAACSGDCNPLHMTDAYARSRGFRGRVAHGALLAAYVSSVIGTQLPGATSLLHSLNMKFVAPVCAGDTVRISVVVEHVSAAAGAMAMTVTIANIDSGDIVARGKAQVGFTRKETLTNDSSPDRNG